MFKHFLDALFLAVIYLMNNTEAIKRVLDEHHVINFERIFCNENGEKTPTDSLI